MQHIFCTAATTTHNTKCTTLFVVTYNTLPPYYAVVYFVVLLWTTLNDATLFHRAIVASSLPALLQSFVAIVGFVPQTNPCRGEGSAPEKACFFPIENIVKRGSSLNIKKKKHDLKTHGFT